MRPERLDVDPHNPDAGKILKFWLKSFELFLKTLQVRQAVTASSSRTTDLPKLRLLLTSLSPAIYEYVEDAQSYQEAVETLKAYKKQKNPVLARHLLATRGQRSKESLAQGCATGGPRTTTRPAKPFSVALANTLRFFPLFPIFPTHSDSLCT